MRNLGTALWIMLAALACHHRTDDQAGQTTAAEANTPVLVEIESHFQGDVVIYLMRGNQRERLGMVTALSATSFTLPVPAPRHERLEPAARLPDRGRERLCQRPAVHPARPVAQVDAGGRAQPVEPGELLRRRVLRHRPPDDDRDVVAPAAFQRFLHQILAHLTRRLSSCGGGDGSARRSRAA